MAINKYCNLYGENKIKDDYTKINDGFEEVETDVTGVLNSESERETAETRREVNEVARKLRYSNTKHYGPYDPDFVYHTNNIVSKDGCSYMLKENLGGSVLESQGFAPPTYPEEENERWKLMGKRGDKGDTGAVPNIQVGAVTTLQPGKPVTVTRQAGSPDEAPVFDFAIPKGADGLGAGDVLWADIDQDHDGVIDTANTALNSGNADKLGGQLPDYYAKETEFDSLANTFNTHQSDYTNHVPHLGITSNVDNSYNITNSKNISDGSKFSVKFNVAATGTATLNISSDGTPRRLIKPGGADFKPKVGTYSFIRDAENFQCLGEGGDYGNVTAPKVFKGVIFGTEDGLDVGTLDIPEEAWWQPRQQWYTCANMESSTFTNDTGSCVCDNKLYHIARLGGGSDDTKVNKTVMYDPYTNIWVEETPPPVAIVYYSYVCGVFNHKIYWHTGAPQISTDTIYIYDTISKTWTNIIVKTTSQHGSRAKWVMTDENTFYCLGGDGVYRVDLYNRVTDTVTQKANAPAYMANAGTLYHAPTNTIYMCGNSYSPSNTSLCAYNCTTDSWTVKTALFSSNPLYFFSMITKDENSFLVGGGYKDSSTAYNSIYYYHIPTDTFTAHLTAPFSKLTGSIGLINNKLYWFGGYTHMGNGRNTAVYFY